MLFHTVLVSAILPPRRQWCHVHVSRGAVREQNLHSTPKWRPEGEVKCTVLVHENILSGEQPELRTASSAARAEKKETKAQLSRARKPRRGVQWGKAPLNFRLNSVRLYDWLGAAETLRPTNAPPSLEAQYRGLWKTCQEKFINKPQNLMLTVSKTSTYCGGYANGRTRQWMRKNTAGTKMKFGARKFCQPRRLPRSWREVAARRPISAKNCPFALDGTKQISVCQKRCTPRISRRCTHSPAESRW